MTTSVVVNTHGGWPVRVREVNPETGGVMREEIMPPATTKTFYFHSSSDMHLHEVQPGETQ